MSSCMVPSCMVLIVVYSGSMTRGQISMTVILIRGLGILL